MIPRSVSLSSALLLLLPLCTASSVAQDWAKTNLAKSPRHGEFVIIKPPNGRNLQAWVVYPEVKEKAPERLGAGDGR